VGPDARGNIPDASIRVLAEVGRWMEKNKESIYGCGAAGLALPDWGRFTRNGNILYAHWMYPIVGAINIAGIGNQVKSVYLLSSGAELPHESTWWGNNEQGNFFVNVRSPVYQTFELPDANDTVIKIVLK
jgi:alpha-L-fucosidase